MNIDMTSTAPVLGSHQEIAKASPTYPTTLRHVERNDRWKDLKESSLEVQTQFVANSLFLCFNMELDHSIQEELLHLDLHMWMERIRGVAHAWPRHDVIPSTESHMLFLFDKLLEISGGTKKREIQSDQMVLLMPQDNLRLIASMCGLSVSESMPFGGTNPHNLLEAMTRSKALAHVIIKPQDIPEWTKKLRDEFPINSENPLSMQLGFEFTDSMEFHRYFDEIHMTYPVLRKLGNQLLLLLTWHGVEVRPRALSSWVGSEEGKKAHEMLCSRIELSASLIELALILAVLFKLTWLRESKAGSFNNELGVWVLSRWDGDIKHPRSLNKLNILMEMSHSFLIILRSVVENVEYDQILRYFPVLRELEVGRRLNIFAAEYWNIRLHTGESHDRALSRFRDQLNEGSMAISSIYEDTATLYSASSYSSSLRKHPSDFVEDNSERSAFWKSLMYGLTCGLFR